MESGEMCVEGRRVLVTDEEGRIYCSGNIQIDIADKVQPEHTNRKSGKDGGKEMREQWRLQ